MYNWKTWLKAAGVRAVRTIAQTALASIGVAAVTEIDWRAVAGTSLLAGLLSVLTSFSGLPEAALPDDDKEEDDHGNSET